MDLVQLKRKFHITSFENKNFWLLDFPNKFKIESFRLINHKVECSVPSSLTKLTSFYHSNNYLKKFFFCHVSHKHMFCTKWSLRSVTSKFGFFYLYQKEVWGAFVS